MKKSLLSTKTIVAIGIGAALFFVLGKFVAIPSGVPNTNIALQYGVLSFLAALFGPVAGALIGFIGHWLIDLTAGWGVWWTWVVGSAIHGLIVGLAFYRFNLNKGEFGTKEIIQFVIFALLASVISSFCNFSSKGLFLKRPLHCKHFFVPFIQSPHKI